MVDGGAGTAGGAVFGAIPVVADGLASSRAVRLPSPPANTSARITTMNTAPAIHPQGAVEPIRSSSTRRSISALRSVMDSFGGIIGPGLAGAAIGATGYPAAGWLFAALSLGAAASTWVAARLSHRRTVVAGP